MRSIRIAIFANLAFALLVFAPGCGGGHIGQSSIDSNSLPAPMPGAAPETQRQTKIRFINQSQNVSAAEWAYATDNINWQITTDLNPRWGTNGLCEVYQGDLDPTKPTVVLQDGPGGGWTDGTVGWCAYNERTDNLWSAYCSHVTINLLTPGIYAGQPVEAWDYRRSDYREEAPWQLADFAFPSYFNRALPDNLDAQGGPAYDLLHRLDYP